VLLLKRNFVNRMSIRKTFVYTFAIALGLLSAGAVLAWTAPSMGFPGGNASAPLNVSGTGQIKSGILTTGGLSAPVFCIGVSCITSWAAAGGSQWTTSGSNIYNNNTGDVEIGNGLSVSNAAGAYTFITLHDDESPNGVKYIHANSNVVGFLSGAQSWLAYWDNSGNQQTTGSINASGAITAAAAVNAGNGGGVLNTNGDVYMSYKGQWLSTALGWNGSNYSPTFGTVTATGNVNAGGATLFTNGDVYMPWAGKYLSTYLSNLNSRTSVASGGQYTTYSNGVCAWANAFTGGCSCPSYAPSARLTGEAASNLGGGWLNVFYYCTG
jgi:hypothetical protein